MDVQGRQAQNCFKQMTMWMSQDDWVSAHQEHLSSLAFRGAFLSLLTICRWIVRGPTKGSGRLEHYSLGLRRFDLNIFEQDDFRTENSRLLRIKPHFP